MLEALYVKVEFTKIIKTGKQLKKYENKFGKVYSIKKTEKNR